MKQRVLLFLAVIVGFIVFSSNIDTRNEDIGATATVDLFAKNAVLFAESSDALYKTIKQIDGDTLSILNARAALINCRMRYKDVSFFVSYFFPSETMMYNAAPKYEVEEPELELVEPMGLQQIEALLFEDDVQAHKAELMAQVDALNSSVKDLKSLLYGFKANDKQVLESIRIEFIRIITLYISGYDAPLLKTGISETLEADRAIQFALQPYFEHSPDHSKALVETLEAAIKYLEGHQQFDTFDRMEYLLKYALPLQEQLGVFIKKEDLELNTSAYLNYSAANIFSKDFLTKWDTIPAGNKKKLAVLGRQLFFDKGLSGNLKVSCASCHQPEKYFSDGRVTSESILKDSVLKRNTPTLLYAGFQHTQFWDGRVKTLAEQIKNVLFNPLEMGGKKELIYKNIIENVQYKESFKTLFPDQKDGYIEDIATAIVAFLDDLNPLNSAFDRYVRGEKHAMTPTQVKGFNLFMGKAQCGTCHFAPYFNALVPPFYTISELEILGTTKNDDFNKPEYDRDMGRYDLYKIRYYKQAFKTPTVRNTAKTGPYMHNGAFKTLESVLDFYNKGGGNGLGLTVEEQTLPSKPLNLSTEEIAQIIQFINSLTDQKTTLNTIN